MSVGIIPQSLPSPTRPPLSGNVFTSMKPGRPKKSKVAYISRQDMLMMLLSAVLSFVLAISIVLVIRYGGPLFVDALLEFFAYPFDMVNEHANITTLSSHVETNHSMFHQLKLIESLDCIQFEKKKLFPLLFSVLGREDIGKNVLALLETNHKIEIVSVSTKVEECSLSSRSLSMFRSVERHAFESDLDSSLSHCFSSGKVLIEQHTELRALIQPPLLPCTGYRSPGDVIEFSSFQDKATLDIERYTKEYDGKMFSNNRSSLHELLVGKKRWFLYEQHRLPSMGFNPLDSIMQWTEDVLPSLSADEKPLEIIQQSGEFVYIPDGWYFASYSLSDESISLRYQRARSDPGTFLYYLDAGRRKQDEGDVAAAIKMYKLGLAMTKDIALIEHLARALENSALYSEAERMYMEAINMNGRNPYNYARLINILVSFSADDESQSVRKLLDKANTMGIRHHVLALSSGTF